MKYYWTRQVKVFKTKKGAKLPYSIKKYHNTFRGLYMTKKELLSEVNGPSHYEFNHKKFKDYIWYEVPVKVSVYPTGP